jgi:hypothetical protein
MPIERFRNRHPAGVSRRKEHRSHQRSVSRKVMPGPSPVGRRIQLIHSCDSGRSKDQPSIAGIDKIGFTQYRKGHFLRGERAGKGFPMRTTIVRITTLHLVCMIRGCHHPGGSGVEKVPYRSAAEIGAARRIQGNRGAYVFPSASAIRGSHNRRLGYRPAYVRGFHGDGTNA